MKTFFKSALVAVALATAGMAGTATTASAGDASFSIVIGSGGYHGGYHGHRPEFREPRGFCSPRKALRKASRLGLRHARIVNINHRVVKVRGRRHGHPVRAVFANTWRCPVVAVR